MDSKQLAAQLQEYVVSFRRELHEHPELSNQEFRTTDRIAKELEGMGLTVRRFDPTGVCADIVGGKPGKMIALRADIDALRYRRTQGSPVCLEE